MNFLTARGGFAMFVVRTHRPSHGKRLLCLLLVIACGVFASALSSVSQNVALALSSVSQSAAPARTPHEDLIACELDGRIYLSSTDGTGQLQLPTHGLVARDPSWSPDGGRVAFQCGGEPADICVTDADGGNLSTLTGEGHSREPAWSPDGRLIAYSYCDADNPSTRLYVMDSDGGNPRRVPVAEASISAERNPSWSPDGGRLAFVGETADGSDIYTVALDGTGAVEAVTRDRADKGQPAFSPDGQHIAFTDFSKKSIEVLHLASGLRRTVASGDSEVTNNEPAWSPDGRRLAFFRHALRVATDTRERTVVQGIYVANADGSGLTRLREPNGHNPAWRPKGARP